MNAREGSHLRRRDLILGGMAVGAAPLLLGGGTATAQESAPAGGIAGSILSSSDANFQTLFVLGAAGYGAAEFGEATTAIDAARAAGGTPAATAEAFWRLGVRIQGLGDAARERGDEVTARSAYLRAAKYLTTPLFFALATDRRSTADQRAVYQAMNRLWTAAATRFGFEPVRIPYGRSYLPGWFLRAPGPKRRRRTVILNNGNDAQNVDLYAWGGAAAIERGWNALIFEGPGQGAMWFERGVPFRPDWEKVVTPIVDWLHHRSDVDPDRIAIIGWSQGGELVARAASRERRLAAVILDPGVTDLAQTIPLPTELWDLIRAGHRDEVNAQWAEIYPQLPASTQLTFDKFVLPFGEPTFYDQVRALLHYDVRDAVRRISAPTLVSQYELDDAVGGEGREVYERLTARHKRFVEFTVAEGAQYHCAPMAPQRRNEVFFDWLDEVVP